MKRTITSIIIFLFLGLNVMFSQIVADTFYVPNYPIPEIYFTDDAPELPDNAWNHKLKYFPDSIVQQLGPTCGQTSGIFNCLTYMFNRAYDRKSDSTNIFPPNYTYNQIEHFQGVSTFDSWNIVKSQGHPSQLEYETINFYASMYNPDSNADHFRNFWMQGYDNYYKSFFNRISSYHSLNVKTDQDLKLLQHFLSNMFELDKSGGVAIFCTNPFSASDRFCNTLFPELYTSYTCPVIDTIYYYDYPTHSMTITGYFHNDSVDFNGDGFITDTIDINNDGVIDMHDNEKILWIVYDSKGQSPPYLLKYDVIELFWNQQVFFPIPDTSYQPELTFKIKLKHPSRGDIKINAGISSDLVSEKPEIEIDFPVFNFQGGRICMTGVDSLDEPDVLEFGIDITDLKNYIPESGNYKVFMQIENRGYSDGEIQYFSIIEYNKESIIEKAIINNPQAISPNTELLFNEIFYIEKGEYNNHFFVNNLNSFTINPGDSIQLTFNTVNGESPFSYHILRESEYNVNLSYESFPNFPETEYDTVILKEVQTNWDIPFSDDLFNSFNIESYGNISFHTNLSPFLERYPYEANKRKYDYLEVCAFQSMINSLIERPIAINQTESEIEIFIKRNTYWPDNNFIPYKFLKITKDGKFMLQYETASQNNNPVLTSNTDKYYIPYEQAIIDTFNTVTFTLNPVDSLFTIDDNGVLTMQPVSEPGKYATYVLVRDAKGQEFTKRIEVNVINENIIGNLYPNPANDIIHCDIYSPIEQDASIEIYTITGQLVYKDVLSQIVGITNYSFSTNQFGQGVYFLRISMVEKSQTQRFAVTK